MASCGLCRRLVWRTARPSPADPLRQPPAQRRAAPDRDDADSPRRAGADTGNRAEGMSTLPPGGPRTPPRPRHPAVTSAPTSGPQNLSFQRPARERRNRRGRSACTARRSVFRRWAWALLRPVSWRLPVARSPSTRR